MGRGIGAGRTYVDQLERVPYVKKRSSSLFQTHDGREAQEVRADLQELVGNFADRAKDVDGCLGDTLEGG